MAIDWTDRPDRFGAISKLLHWGVALAVFGLIGWGWWMTDLAPSLDKLRAYNLHKAAGVCVLAVVLLRLFWRLATPRPEPVAMPRWQRLAATAVHAGLYACLLGMPVLGWVGSSAAGLPVDVFGLATLPRIAPVDEGLRDVALAAHAAMSRVLLVLILVHVAAALKHHLHDRDETLVRMLPFARRRRNGVRAS